MREQPQEPVDWKEEARKQWTAHPCGSVGEVREDLEYFLEVERNRYERYAPWMRETFQFQRWRGKRVLEIGFGQGTDLVQYASSGATCFGVDITERHLELAKKHFEVRDLDASLLLDDASSLPFDDSCFDLVHSFGVLHHAPDTEKCFAEAYRVLKPGGEFLVGLYHRWSAFHLFSVLFERGLIRGHYLRLGYGGLLSTIEKGADGTHLRPLVKLYSRRELIGKLSAFRRTTVEIKHLEKSHFGRLGRWFPSSGLGRLEPRMGWYLIARATK